MKGEPIVLVKARYFSSVALLYVATLFFIGYTINPYHLFYQPALSAQFAYTIAPPVPVVSEETPQIERIAGMPSRMVIPSLGLDHQILPGVYDAASQTWTLNEYDVHFALPSMQPNNISGGTFLYGHNYTHTLGKLTRLQPGATVDIHTDNGHLFTYRYEAVENTDPSNVAVFQYEGKPRLSIQTCAGWLNKLRGIFHFSLISVDGNNV